jgi:autotransporter-associated beta strand protein
MRHPVLTLLVLAAGLAAGEAQDSSGEWMTASGGSWANAGNWLDGTIANGTDNTAFFGVSFYPVNTTATFTLDGAQTIGNLVFTAQTTPSNWSLNTGTGGPLTLDASFDLPSVDVSTAGLQVTVNAVLAGTNGLEKLGAGALVLTATNIYSGGTTLSSGTLLVNGRLTDTGMVTVASGTLGGTGIIYGPVTVESGGIFSPGGAPGTLTISNTLALQSGSKTWMDVNASTLAHDLAQGLAAASYGGTLTVSNLAGTPSAGESFQIFRAAGASGNFSGITPQLTGALRWRFDPDSGALSVVGTNWQPNFSSLTLLSKTNLVIWATNGVPDGTNYLLAATNLALPRANWTRVATNVFDAGGNLVLTNGINSSMPQRFYLILTGGG